MPASVLEVGLEVLDLEQGTFGLLLVDEVEQGLLRVVGRRAVRGRAHRPRPGRRRLAELVAEEVEGEHGEEHDRRRDERHVGPCRRCTPRPSLIICPQLALGSLTDRPRKARCPRRRWPRRWRRARTPHGRITFGRISRSMIRRVLRAHARAAAMHELALGVAERVGPRDAGEGGDRHHGDGDARRSRGRVRDATIARREDQRRGRPA